MIHPEKLLGLNYRDLAASGAISDCDMPAPEKIGDQSYMELPMAGISLVLPDHEMVAAVHLHAAGHEGFTQFLWPLPQGLSFELRRADVRRILGEPRRHGPEAHVQGLGLKPAWDSFGVGGVRVHVEYGLEDGRIQMVTLT